MLSASPLQPKNLHVLNDGGNFSSNESSSGSSCDSDISNARAVRFNSRAPTRSSNIPYIIVYTSDLVIKLDLVSNAKIKPTINTLNGIEADNIRTKTVPFGSSMRDFYINNRARIDAIKNGTESYSNLQDKTNILGNDVLIATNSLSTAQRCSGGSFISHPGPSVRKYNKRIVKKISIVKVNTCYYIFKI